MRRKVGELYSWRGGLYDHAGTENLFLEAMREDAAFHYRHNGLYRRLLEGQGWTLKRIAAMEGPEELPPIPTLFLKRHRLFTMDPKRLAIRATSSGTEGLKSQVGFDGGSALRGARMAWRVGRRHGLFTARPANYVMLGYEPHPSNQTVIVKTQHISSWFAPPRHRTYAITWGGDGYRPDLEGLLEGLERYAKERTPVRVIGFPFYLYLLLRYLKGRGRRFKLPAGSRILLGGGWKQHEAWKVEPEELYGLAEEILGIGEGCCLEFFGAAEHPSLYCSCPCHHFHVPVYSRAVVRDVNTLKPLGYGSPGLLNLLTPLAASMPLGSILTDDIAVLHRGRECGCGINAPYFEIVGRAGVQQIRTCAADAWELWKTKKP